ncbi:MAG: PKD domain-containing protein [Ancrocorticia sp.]
MNSLRRRFTAVLAAVATAITGGLVLTPAASAAPGEMAAVSISDADTVSADALPAPQMNGVVWQQEIVGSTVYAVGNFSKARPAGSAVGQNEVNRNHVLAYNIDTGALLPFAPNVNGQVYDVEVSPDGKTLYIVGTFTSVNGQSRLRAAAFDTASGALKTWRPVLNYNATVVTVTGTTVYMGGMFTTVNNQSRTRLVGVDTRTGTTNTPLNATIPDGDIRGIEVSPDGTQVVIGGSFTSVNGSDSPGFGLARLNVATNELLPFPLNDVVRNAGPNSSIYRLNSDASGIYAVAYDYMSTSEFEGGVHTDWEGNILWFDACKGDSYDIWPNDKVVYVASHKHNCDSMGNVPNVSPWIYHHASANTNFATGVNVSADYAGQPSPTMYAFRPEFQVGTFTGASQAVWSVTGTDKYVLYAGEFLRVNNKAQQGIVRFARRSAADKQGPMIGSANGAPILTSVPHTGMRVSVPGNYDRDDYQLRYIVYRNNTNTVIYDGVRDSRWYDRTGFSIIDTGATPGQTVRYKVLVTDPKGNQAHSSWSEAVAPAAAPVSTVASKVIADSPLHYWRLNEPEGTVSYDWVGNEDLTLAGTTRAVAGPHQSQTTQFAGTNSSYGSTSVATRSLYDFSLEMWFKTSKSGGGKLLGFGNKSTGNSNNHDRTLYIDKQNLLSFGLKYSPNAVLKSATAVNDGKWHHVVGTLEGSTMRLYVDGQLVGERTDTPLRRVFRGYWRVGGDGDNAWAGSNYFNGQIGDAAVYAKALTAEQVAHHFSGSIAQPPTANFVANPTNLQVAFNASTSSAMQGATITSYEWDFGDGNTATGGPTKAYTYASPGTYQVKLTVTDSNGLTGTSTNPVTVTHPGGPEQSYPQAVLSDNPTLYYQLGGSTVNLAGSNPPRYGAQVSTVTPGGVTGSIASSSSFVGTNTSIVSSSAKAALSSDMSQELWFNTTTTSGGKLIGYGSTLSANSANTDRNVYLTNAGKVAFGVNSGGKTAITSAKSYNDGKWHHVVATLGSDGMKLYLDGELVGARADITQGAAFTGYWRIGGDAMKSWPGNPSSVYFTGLMNDVAIYPSVLSSAQVAKHYSLGKSTVTPPVDPGIPGTVAADDFGRNVASGWGNADTGGEWTTWAPIPSRASVDGSGKITLPNGFARTLTLKDVSAQDTESSVKFSLTNVPSDGGESYVGISSRMSADTAYQVRLRLKADGTVWIVPRRGTTNFTATQVAGLSWAAGEVLNLKMQVTGTSPTTIRTKVWKEGSAEPTDWQSSVTDSTPALQGAGYVGLFYSRAGTGPASATIAFKNYRVTNLAPSPAAQAAPLADVPEAPQAVTSPEVVVEAPEAPVAPEATIPPESPEVAQDAVPVITPEALTPQEVPVEDDEQASTPEAVTDEAGDDLAGQEEVTP